MMTKGFLIVNETERATNTDPFMADSNTLTTQSVDLPLDI